MEAVYFENFKFTSIFYNFSITELNFVQARGMSVAETLVNPKNIFDMKTDNYPIIIGNKFSSLPFLIYRGIGSWILALRSHSRGRFISGAFIGENWAHPGCSTNEIAVRPTRYDGTSGKPLSVWHIKTTTSILNKTEL